MIQARKKVSQGQELKRGREMGGGFKSDLQRMMIFRESVRGKRQQDGMTLKQERAWYALGSKKGEVAGVLWGGRKGWE